MKRWLITAALVMFTVGTLVGCAKKGDTPPTAEEAEATAAAMVEEAAAPAEHPAAPADHPAH